jgi:hypothetical protein
MSAVPYDPLRLPAYQFEQYVVPVFTATPDGPATVHGTAFFINGDGVFLTAGHVIEAAQSVRAQIGARSIWLTVRIPDSNAGTQHEITSTESAPAPFDIAIGKVSAASQSFVRLADASAGAPLSDVWTFGYPESAHARTSSGRLMVGQRSHKGYIIRRLMGDELAFPSAPGFELNFPIPSALSGAPLVLERPATAVEHALMAAPGMVPMIGGGIVDVRFMPKHALHLIGVCIGTTEAETVAFSHTEVIDGTTRFSEKTSKIELYGLANDLLPLADWKPSCLGGATLAQAIEPT